MSFEEKFDEVQETISTIDNLLKEYQQVRGQGKDRVERYIAALNKNGRYYKAILKEIEDQENKSHSVATLTFIGGLCRDALRELAMINQEYEK